MAIKGELDTTAVSAHAYLHLHNTYRIMDCGASMGDNYGPILVSKKDTIFYICDHDQNCI